jgi:hypothetical protein
MKKYFFVYKTTRTDGRYYLGMHSTSELNDGYLGSGKILKQSIKKHGVEQHTREILGHASSIEELKLLEQKIITREHLSNPLCMNLKLGGEGGWDYIHINNLHDRTGLKHTEEVKQLISDMKKGRKASDETKQKISDNHFSKNNPDKFLEVITKNGKLPKSQSHRDKISASRKENNLRGENSPNFGLKRERITCPYCLNTYAKHIISRFHLENCKNYKAQNILTSKSNF